MAVVIEEHKVVVTIPCFLLRTANHQVLVMPVPVAKPGIEYYKVVNPVPVLAAVEQVFADLRDEGRNLHPSAPEEQLTILLQDAKVQDWKSKVAGQGGGYAFVGSNVTMSGR
jgi:hypothetical protein